MIHRRGRQGPSLGPRGEDVRRGVLLGLQPQQALAKGMEVMTNALAVTLGPAGGTVFIDPPYGKTGPEAVSRGAIVARRVIEIPNRYVNAGAMLIRHLAWNVRERVGDGSVTAAVLARALAQGGMRMAAAGANPMVMQRGMQRAIRTTVDQLKAMSRPLDSTDGVASLARAVTGDPELASLIAEIFDYVGVDGVVVVEEHAGRETDRQYLQGVRWDSGLAAGEFITDVAAQRAVLTNPVIALATMHVTSAQQVLPVMQKALEAKAESLVLVAPKIELEALGALVVNHQQGKLPIAAVVAPGTQVSHAEILEDLAVLTGARLINDKAGQRLEDLRGEDLGRARRIVATRREFSIIGAKGRPREIRRRIAALQTEIDALNRQEFGHTWGNLRRRLANLSGGVAVLRVRAVSAIDGEIKRAAAEDAVQAVRAALEEGVVPGGGAAYVACIPALKALAATIDESDEAAGVRIVAEALSAPVRQIAENAGHRGSTVAARLESAGPGHAFDAITGRIVAVRDAGILDPAKVVRVALEMAGSTAAMALTTGAIVLTERMGALEAPREGRQGTLRGTSIEP